MCNTYIIYIYNCNIYIKIDNSYSSPSLIIYGIPQESVLGTSLVSRFPISDLIENFLNIYHMLLTYVIMLLPYVSMLLPYNESIYLYSLNY